MNAAYLQVRSSRSSASRSPYGTASQPGISGWKSIWSSVFAVTDSEPMVLPWNDPKQLRKPNRPVAARASLSAASVDSVPLFVKNTIPSPPGAMEMSSSASAVAYGLTADGVNPGG